MYVDTPTSHVLSENAIVNQEPAGGSDLRLVAE